MSGEPKHHTAAPRVRRESGRAESDRRGGMKARGEASAFGTDMLTAADGASAPSTTSILTRGEIERIIG